LPSQISQVVEQEIAEGHFPGAVVVVGMGGKVVYRGAFGDQAKAPERLPMRVDTIFDLASLTKVIATTPAILQLVEQGRIDIDDSVAKYWPGFANNGKGAITVKNLLTHTSGLRPDLDLSSPWEGEKAAFKLVEAEKPQSPPGAKFEYSDINFIALAELLRRVSAERLDRYAERHIFAPLGMSDTRFLPDPSLRPRIAPTGAVRGEIRWGVVQDPIAYRMGGVAGHAGLFGTADDLAKFAEMVLQGGSLDHKQALAPASVLAMTVPHRAGNNAIRGLGWDMVSPYSGGQDAAFGAESFGHTGYTGTSLWIDPKRGSFLIILTSRLHPDDAGDARPVRRRLAELVAANLPSQVLTGIDVLESEAFAPLAGKRLGLLTNQTGRDAAGRRTIDMLARADGPKLVTIFSPEHGVEGSREGSIGTEKDAATGLPIHSLYGASLRPDPAVLAHLDAVVVDLQDVGARFYTYAATMAYAMESAAKAGVGIIVLDRPNPVTGARVQGPMLDVQKPSLTGYFPMPVRHGMTIGELAEMFNAEYGIGANLTVIPMRGYNRDLWFDETGLNWINPSPNLRSLTQATLYSGVALIEGANVSVGRGTATPFELVGAPWIEGDALAGALDARAIPGVRFSPTRFTPTADRYAGRICEGVKIELIDRLSLDAPRLGIELAAALLRLYPEQFEIERTIGMVGSRATMIALQDGVDPAAISKGWNAELEKFRAIRAKYLLYD
jgi:uncharacterized protein YbbC (DUF1343 family)/CubicO group peptidase (beta-lactamase class C family)